MKKYLFLTICAGALCSCETTNLTPQEAEAAASAARAWLDVAREAKTIILEDK